MCHWRMISHSLGVCMCMVVSRCMRIASVVVLVMSVTLLVWVIVLVVV